MSDDELRKLREQWLICSHDLERIFFDLQLCRQALRDRTSQLQIEQENRNRQQQEARKEAKRTVSHLKEARDFLEKRTEVLQETVRRLRESEAQLAQARRTLDQASEGERARISEDLHSGPVHKISEAIIRLDELLQLATDESTTSELAVVRQDLEEALSMTDRAVHQLKPVELKRGLSEGLKALFYRMFPNRQQSRFSASPLQKLDDWSELMIYRFATEALNNVQRHGRRSINIELILDVKNDYLNLSINNELNQDGGESSTKSGDQDGHGKHNMEAYARLLNSSVEFSHSGLRYEVRLRKRLSDE